MVFVLECTPQAWVKQTGGVGGLGSTWANANVIHPVNAGADDVSVNVDDAAIFQCTSGWKLMPLTDTITCQNGGTWSVPHDLAAPLCERTDHYGENLVFKGKGWTVG